MLSETGRRLQAIIRNTDMVCRLGGDEFGVVITELTDESELLTIQEKIIQALSAPYHINGDTHHLGASIGKAIFPEHGIAPDNLTHQADLDMYKMKRKQKQSRSLLKAK